MIGPLVTLYRKLYVDEMAFVNQLVTVISDVRVPMRTELQQLSQEKQRKIDIKVGHGGMCRHRSMKTLKNPQIYKKLRFSRFICLQNTADQMVQNQSRYHT